MSACPNASPLVTSPAATPLSASQNAPHLSFCTESIPPLLLPTLPELALMTLSPSTSGLLGAGRAAWLRAVLPRRPRCAGAVDRHRLGRHRDVHPQRCGARVCAVGRRGAQGQVQGHGAGAGRLRWAEPTEGGEADGERRA
eukprot:126935-Chlamydomonas_euryale.AAC.1